MPALILLYAVVPGLQIWFYVQGLLMWDLPELANYVSAIVCFHWMLNNVLLSAKLPALQRSLPYDARIRFHLLGTIGLAATMFYHAAYKILLGKRIDLVSWSLLGGFILLAALGILWIPLPVFKPLREKVQAAVKRGFLKSYDLMKRLHIVLLLSLCALMYYHVLLANLFRQVPPYSRWIYNLFFFGSIAVYLFSKFRNRFLLPSVKLSGIEGKAGVFTLKFEGERAPYYRPGQFAFIRFDRREFRGEEHPFSFLSAPGEAQTSFGIRMLGDFSKTLEILRPGDTAKINGGFGAFHPAAVRKEPALCFIGSGIGVIPFISILKEMKARGDQRPLRFFLAVNTEDEIPEFDSFAALVAGMPGLRLDLLVYEKDKTLFSYEYFKERIPDPSAYTYYLCSSERVRRIVQDALRGLGVKKRKIRFEAFTFG